MPFDVRRRLRFLHVAPALNELTCGVCGATGPVRGYKAWALAGTDDAGNFLRRCQRCGAEMALRYSWKWWEPTEVWLASRTPEPGKEKRRRRERRFREREARALDEPLP